LITLTPTGSGLEIDHGPHAHARGEVGESFVDLVERPASGDERLEIELDRRREAFERSAA